MKRGSSADEVARAVTWLRSEDASYVTGTHVDVSGGVIECERISIIFWCVLHLFLVRYNG